MVNTDDFIKRLEFLMENYSLNASAFADKIGVQRSSISHLLSGRNKPSLDFVLKIQEFLPEVNLYWILNGKEKFLKHEQKENNNIEKKQEVAPTLFEVKSLLNSEKNDEVKIENIAVKNTIPISSNHQDTAHVNSNIFKIVIFYNDGSFKDFVQG